MVDLTTVGEVEAGGYTVRVGRTEGHYEATVIDTPSSGSSKPNSFRMHFSMAITSTQDTGDEEIIAPVATAPHYWVAVGLAIESYQSIQESGPETEDVYESMSVDFGDLDAEEILEELGPDT